MEVVSEVRGIMEVLDFGGYELMNSIHNNQLSGDVIMFINQPNDYLKTERAGSVVCRWFKIWKGIFSVAELIMLSHIIHECNSSYHMICHQCYWFANTIYKVTRVW